MTEPRRRKDDRGWRRRLHWFVRENAYRDVWLLAITILAWAATVHASDAAKRIQNQRVQAILAACEAQNARHDATIRQLDSEIAQITKINPRAAREARANRKFTIELIDTLAPKQDCGRVLAAATDLPLPPPVARRHRR